MALWATKSDENRLWGGQFCPQPAFSRLWRASLACADRSVSAAGRVPAPRGVSTVPHLSDDRLVDRLVVVIVFHADSQCVLAGRDVVQRQIIGQFVRIGKP